MLKRHWSAWHTSGRGRAERVPVYIFRNHLKGWAGPTVPPNLALPNYAVLRAQWSPYPRRSRPCSEQGKSLSYLPIFNLLLTFISPVSLAEGLIDL